MADYFLNLLSLSLHNIMLLRQLLVNNFIICKIH